MVINAIFESTCTKSSVFHFQLLFQLDRLETDVLLLYQRSDLSPTVRMLATGRPAPLLRQWLSLVTVAFLPSFTAASMGGMGD